METVEYLIEQLQDRQKQIEYLTFISKGLSGWEKSKQYSKVSPKVNVKLKAFIKELIKTLNSVEIKDPSMASPQPPTTKPSPKADTITLGDLKVGSALLFKSKLDGESMRGYFLKEEEEFLIVELPPDRIPIRVPKSSFLKVLQS